MSQIAAAALENELAGFEFASGIPGTIGGAAVMNAGAYGGEMKDVIVQVTALDRDGNMIVLSQDELEFGYRTSAVMKRGCIVLEACIRLEKGSREEILMKMEISSREGSPSSLWSTRAQGAHLSARKDILRETDSGCGSSGIYGRRSAGIGKAQRFRDQ